MEGDVAAIDAGAVFLTGDGSDVAVEEVRRSYVRSRTRATYTTAAETNVGGSIAQKS